MSLNPQYKNLDAPQLRVPAASAQFPLSSPISDDQISTRSFDSKRTAASSDLSNSPQSSHSPFGDTESGNTSGQDEFHLERYSESSNRTKSEGTRRQPEQRSKFAKEERDGSLERRKKPDLNIVTDFSGKAKNNPLENAAMHQMPAQRAKLGREPIISNLKPQPTVQQVSSKERFRNPGFVNLSDLEGLRKANKKRAIRPSATKGDKRGILKYHARGQEAQIEQNRVGLEISGVFCDPPLREESGKNQFPASGRGHDLTAYRHQAPKQGLNEISPTARSVVIGISVPENEVEAHKPSDEASSALTLQTPITPSIVVTPADATMGWSAGNMQGSSMKRAASSMYSQMSGAVYRQDNDAPPVPSLPHQHRPYPDVVPGQSRHSIDTWESDSPDHQRPCSTGTIIDDEDVHQAQPGPLSAGNKDETLLSSCTTGRPPSKGWWNLMLSPMLSRAGTNVSKKTSPLTEEAPELPILAISTDKGLGLAERTPTTAASSPETPRRAGLDKGGIGAWSNWSQWERDREHADALERLSENDQDTKSDPPRNNESNQCDPVLVGSSVKKQGLAAEYFQACAFDLLNPVPYFECVNHDCANALPKLGAFTERATGFDGPKKVPEFTEKRTMESLPLREEAHVRSDSDSTIIEDDRIELSPNVRKADARPILKAAQPQKIEASQHVRLDEKDDVRSQAAKEEQHAALSTSAIPPPYSSPPAKTTVPRYIGIMPPNHDLVPSPGPLSPEAQKAMNPNGGMPMVQIHQSPPTFINFSTTYPADLPPRPVAVPVSLSDIENPAEVRRRAEARRQRLEQEDAVAQRAGGLWRGRGCFPERGCFGQGGSTGRTRRRWYVAISTGFVLMIVLIVVLATQLTRKGDRTPVQSQWLNLTGYPPMPTGISTIARPDVASAVTACVQPTSLWSCALPREDQSPSSSNPDQPNFRLEIRFRNGTVDANGTVPISDAIDKRATGSRRVALLRRQNDPFTNSLFQSNPDPPTLEEQTFLGNTTDKNALPFSGETTPFFITILTSDPTLPNAYNDTGQPARRRFRRQSGTSSGSIPAPAVLSDGTAAPANLLPNKPLPFSQPIKLYNRGLDTEHYGFYTYFDRSVFIKATAEFNSTISQPVGGNRSDDHNANGGSSKEDADLRCTWAQTRFLVQIWTNSRFPARLLPSSNGGNASSSSSSSSGPANDVEASREKAGKSSATDFDRPGSFPYPVTVTLDRHGGDAAKKGVYCYGMDGEEKIVAGEKKLVAELRGAGGVLVNEAPGIFSAAAGSDGFDGNAGGIDGGTGGCGCEWRNWVGNGGG